MNLNIKIKNIDHIELKKLDIKCKNCSFWFDFQCTDLVSDFNRSKTVWDLIKEKIFEYKNTINNDVPLTCFLKNGGILKAALVDDICAGVILAGRYFLFPKIKAYDIYPPDGNSIFIACLHVYKGYRGRGIEKRLLHDFEKDMILKDVSSVETIGKRLNDDIDEEEYKNSPLIPIKFLIQNGFYIEKNHELFPLMKLDLKSIATDGLLDKLALERLTLKKEISKPVAINKTKV